jgi:hypothetical protein
MSSYRSSMSRDAVEYLWNGKRGRPITIAEWTRAVYGHAAPSLQRKMVTSISAVRRYAERRGYGMLVSVHESVENRTKVTHILLADEGTNPKYVARELTMRQARALGMIRSRDRGIKLAYDQKLLPHAEVQKALKRPGEQLFLAPADQEKQLKAAAERAERKRHPQLGKAVHLAEPPKARKSA